MHKLDGIDDKDAGRSFAAHHAQNKDGGDGCETEGKLPSISNELHSYLGQGLALRWKSAISLLGFIQIYELFLATAIPGLQDTTNRPGLVTCTHLLCQ